MILPGCSLSGAGGVPVVMVTARSDLGLDAHAAANGAICLLRKPFKTEALIDCLEKALEALSGLPEVGAGRLRKIAGTVRMIGLSRLDPSRILPRSPFGIRNGP